MELNTIQLMSSTVNDINDKFDQRLVRTDNKHARPVNPFAKVSSQDSVAKFRENLFRPQVSETMKLGNVYQGHVVETKFEDTVLFDERSVHTNPKAGLIKFTPNRLAVEHTREK